MKERKRHAQQLYSLLLDCMHQEDYETAFKVYSIAQVISDKLPGSVWQIGLDLLHRRGDEKGIYQLLLQTFHKKNSKQQNSVDVLKELVNYQILYGRQQEAYDNLNCYIDVEPYKNSQELQELMKMLQIYLSK